MVTFKAAPEENANFSTQTDYKGNLHMATMTAVENNGSLQCLDSKRIQHFSQIVSKSVPIVLVKCAQTRD